MDQLTTQAVFNFIVVYVIRFAETSKWPWLETVREDAVWLRRLIILVFSTLTAAGLVFHFEVQTGNFVLSGNIWSILHAVKHIAQNYAGITGMYWVKFIYDTFSELKPVLENTLLPKTAEKP